MLALLALGAISPWKLVWSDEFDRPGPPDLANWRFERGFVRNRELQWYQAENATVTGGSLTIEARREHTANRDFDTKSTDWRKSRMFADYTSSALETRNLHDWLYGRFEVRARIDPQDGLWPAIWFLGYGPWPGNGEIDLMEYYDRTMLANLAWGVGRATWRTSKTPLSRFLAKNPRWGERFHVWRMDWDEEWIRLYLDDELLNETELSKTVNSDGSNPFHKRHFILLNLAIGSTGGDPAPLSFPRRFEIDYVRVYQRS